MIKKKFNQALDIYFNELSTAQRLYVNVALWAVIFLICTIPIIPKDVAVASLVFLCLYVSVAVLVDIAKIYKVLWESTLGKAVLLLVNALLFTLALSIAAETVHSISGLNPNSFPRTIAFAVVMIIPDFVAIGLTLAQYALALSAVLILIALMLDRRIRRFIFALDGGIAPSKVGALSHAMAVICWVIFLFVIPRVLTGAQKDYDPWAVKQVKSFLFHFEMYENSRCRDIGNKRVAYLDGNTILVAGPDLSASKIRKCSLIEEDSEK